MKTWQPYIWLHTETRDPYLGIMIGLLYDSLVLQINFFIWHVSVGIKGVRIFAEE